MGSVSESTDTATVAWRSATRERRQRDPNLQVFSTSSPSIAPGAARTLGPDEVGQRPSRLPRPVRATRATTGAMMKRLTPTIAMLLLAVGVYVLRGAGGFRRDRRARKPRHGVRPSHAHHRPRRPPARLRGVPRALRGGELGLPQRGPDAVAVDGHRERTGVDLRWVRRSRRSWCGGGLPALPARSGAFRPSGAEVEVDYLVKDVRGRLAYTVAIERADVLYAFHTALKEQVLRVTMMFRFEKGDWKIIHRHADMMVDLQLPTP